MMQTEITISFEAPAGQRYIRFPEWKHQAETLDRYTRPEISYFEVELPHSEGGRWALDVTTRRLLTYNPIGQAKAQHHGLETPPIFLSMGGRFDEVDRAFNTMLAGIKCPCRYRFCRFRSTSPGQLAKPYCVKCGALLGPDLEPLDGQVPPESI